MEESRLTPMVEHDPVVFKLIYEKTQGLKRKLASEIDYRRFGLTYEDMVSWFDIKLLFVFNKYYNKHNPQVLLGHVINSLQLFKCRILRAAYTKKYTQTIIEMGESDEYENILIDDELHNSNKDLFYDLAVSFMIKHLSENAYELFQVQLNPPPFILHRLEEERIRDKTKIPNHILAEYFDFDNSDKSIKYLDSLKKEINNGINIAREYFQNKGMVLGS